MGLVPVCSGFRRQQLQPAWPGLIAASSSSSNCKVSYAAMIAEVSYAAMIAEVSYAAMIAEVSYAAMFAEVSYAAMIAEVSYAAMNDVERFHCMLKQFM